MNIEISNLRYSDMSNNNIDMDVVGVMPGESMPFTYSQNDSSPLSIIVRGMLEGGQYEIAEYKEPLLTQGG